MDYEDFRKKAKTGDVLGVKGDKLFGKLIKWITKEEYTHVALLVWHGNGLWVYEFVERLGYQCMPASQWFDLRQGQKIFFGRAPLAVTSNPIAVMQAASNFRATVYRQHYGIITLIKVALAQWFKVKIKTHFEVCSTFVEEVWVACGYNDFKMTPDPGNIMKHASRLYAPVAVTKQPAPPVTPV